MKRGNLIFIIAAMLLVLPCAFSAPAEVTFSGPSLESYNVGDKIDLSGKITAEETISRGYLTLFAECSGLEYPKPMSLPIMISLNAGSEKSFPAEISTPEIIAKKEMIGECRIKAVLTNNNIETEAGMSSSFKVTKELRGTFDIDEDNVQLGKIIKVTGLIQKYDGTPISGNADVFLKQGSIKYPAGQEMEITNGIFNFELDTKSMPIGNYVLQVNAIDLRQNEQLFNAAEFSITDELNFYAETDKYEYLPGEKVIILGEAKNVVQEPVSIVSSYVKMGSSEFAAIIRESKISYSLELPTNVKAGKHTIYVSARDEFGNHAETPISILINPIASKLSIDLNTAQSYRPLDEIKAVVALYDQAMDFMSKYIQVSVINPEDEVSESYDIVSGQELRVKLPEHSMPGEWKIEAKIGSIIEKAAFQVEEVKVFSASVTGNVISITNDGNVKITDPFDINLDGEGNDFSFRAKSKINPGETATIDLSEKAPSGIYTMAILTPEGEKDFESVLVSNGKALMSFNGIFIGMVALLLGMMGFMVYTHSRKRSTLKLGEHDLHKIAKVKTEYFKKRDETEKSRFNEVEDFKTRTLAEIKKTQDFSPKPKYAQYSSPWRRASEERIAQRKAARESVPRSAGSSSGNNKDAMGGAAGFFGGF